MQGLEVFQRWFSSRNSAFGAIHGSIFAAIMFWANLIFVARVGGPVPTGTSQDDVGVQRILHQLPHILPIIVDLVLLVSFTQIVSAAFHARVFNSIVAPKIKVGPDGGNGSALTNANH